MKNYTGRSSRSPSVLPSEDLAKPFDQVEGDSLLYLIKVVAVLHFVHSPVPESVQKIEIKSENLG